MIEDAVLIFGWIKTTDTLVFAALEEPPVFSSARNGRRKIVYTVFDSEKRG